MSISTDEAHLDSDESLREQPRAEAPGATQPSAPGPVLLTRLGALLRRVEPQPLRALVSPIFDDLARLLDYLSLIEGGLSRDESLQKTGIIFRLVHEKTLSLLRRLEEGAERAGRFDEGVSEVLDQVGFAVTHELRRVFRDEAPRLNDSQHTQLSRAELVRAYGLLHNCFQQSTITLAQAFDPALDGAQLFEDYKTKVEQSLVLYGGLLSLLRQVHDAQETSGVLSKRSLANHLERFRDETMHFLMYKDWADFERFVGEVLRTYDEPEDFGQVLHRFAGYLGTLLRHVGMRDVLRGRPPTGGEGTRPVA